MDFDKINFIAHLTSVVFWVNVLKISDFVVGYTPSFATRLAYNSWKKGYDILAKHNATGEELDAIHAECVRLAKQKGFE